jgi:hypothetical protein
LRGLAGAFLTGGFFAAAFLAGLAGASTLYGTSLQGFTVGLELKIFLSNDNIIILLVEYLVAFVL